MHLHKESKSRFLVNDQRFGSTESIQSVIGPFKYLSQVLHNLGFCFPTKENKKGESLILIVSFEICSNFFLNIRYLQESCSQLDGDIRDRLVGDLINKKNFM